MPSTRLVWLTAWLAGCSAPEQPTPAGADVTAPDAGTPGCDGSCAPAACEPACAVGVSCEAGQCAVERDDYEDNDTRAAASTLLEIEDAATVDRAVLSLTIDSVTDEDWFEIPFRDVATAVDAKVHIYLNPDLTQAPSAAEMLHYQLSVWFRCGTVDAGSRVGCSTTTGWQENDAIDPALGTGCHATGYGDTILPLGPYAILELSCATLDESGTIVFRVRKPLRVIGDRYWLNIATQH